MTSTLTMPRVITADEQASATTKTGLTTGSEHLPFGILLADLDPTIATTTEQDRGQAVRTVLSVEARIRLSAQDEEYDVSLIRNEDLLPQLAYQRGVFWGVVPYTPAAPFSVKFMTTYEEVDSFGDLAREIRDQDIKGQLPFSVEGKMRPVLAISEPSPMLRDIVALRLVNITRRLRDKHMTEEDERALIDGKHSFLVALRPEVVRALTPRTRAADRYAVSIDPVILNQSACSTTPIGEVTPEEFAVICERFVEVLDLDLGYEEEEPPEPA